MRRQEQKKIEALVRKLRGKHMTTPPPSKQYDNTLKTHDDEEATKLFNDMKKRPY